MTERVLDRRPQQDERSLRLFNIADVMETRAPRSYTWACSTNLDQGREGACVAFGWTQEAAARPKVHTVDNSLARSLYPRMQRVDEWEGEEPTYSGTSVLAGAKIAKEQGWIGEYRWTDDLMDALAAVSYWGPAVIGVDWYSGMFDTDSNGFIYPTGRVEGGHCILVRGVSLKKQAVLLHNSWGPNWGGTEKGPGTAWLAFHDFRTLIDNNGDVCIPVKRF
jgi:hypothetical protein